MRSLSGTATRETILADNTERLGSVNCHSIENRVKSQKKASKEQIKGMGTKEQIKEILTLKSMKFEKAAVLNRYKKNPSC